MRLTQEPAEIGITSRGFGQEGHVAATGEWVAVGIATQITIRVAVRAAASVAPCITGRIVHTQSVQALGDPRNVQGHRDLGTRDGLKS